MIKRVKELSEAALIANLEFRGYVESLESEILRGTSTLCVLSIINLHGIEGTYGYQLLRDLEEQTKGMLVIEEGTLYPILRNLEKKGIVRSEKKEQGGRKRKYYFLTSEGSTIYNHVLGFFTKLIESIGNLVDLDVKLKDTLVYCPNCANKIDARDSDTRFCVVCGNNVEELKEKRLKEIE